MDYFFPESFTFKLIVICQADEVSALEASFVSTTLYFSKYSEAVILSNVISNNINQASYLVKNETIVNSSILQLLIPFN